MKSYSMLCLLAVILTADLSAQSAFVENRGQWDAQARYYVQLPGLDAWVTDDGITYDVYAQAPSSREPLANTSIPDRSGHVVRMRFEGAAGRATAAPADRQKGIYNYIKGSDSTKWITHVPLFNQARIDHLYKGIDALLQFQENALRYDLVVAPGADAAHVRMKFEGAQSVRVCKSGELEISTSSGMIRQRGLRAFQTLKNGRHRTVKCRFQVIDSITVRFLVGDYDKSLALTIDPLVYSTYVSPGTFRNMSDMAVDKDGCAHVLGLIVGNAFPTTTGAYHTTGVAGETNIVVFKLAADGTSLLYGTFLNGGLSNLQSNAYIDLTLDIDGNAVIVGSTSAVDFPTTNGVVQRTLKGGSDAYVTKFNATGSALVYSTLIGGDDNEAGEGIAIDGLGNVYITGVRSGVSFPTTPGAYMVTPQGRDAFVVKFNNTCTAVAYATLLGASGLDDGHRIAVDRAGNAYVSGSTTSGDLPTTPGAYNSSVGRAFLAKINATGSDAVYLTYLDLPAGTDTYLRAIAVDSLNHAVIAGSTGYPNYPTTAGALKTTMGTGDRCGFITKFNNTGTGVIYSTFFGGSDIDRVGYMTCDGAGNVYVGGSTTSPDFPTTVDAYDRTLGTNGDGADAFVAVINPAGDGLLYSSYVGGSLLDEGTAVALDSVGGIYLGGNTNSTDFPTTAGAFGRTNNASSFFVTKIDVCRVTMQPVRDTGMCKGASVMIGGLQATGGVPPYRYKWEPSTGLSNDTLFNPVASPIATATYHLAMTDGVGCVIRDTLVVTVWDARFANAGPDTVVCANASVSIGRLATGLHPPYTYQWTPVAGLSTPNAAVTQAQPLVDTRYVVRVTDGKGCIDFDTVDVIANDPITIEAGPDVVICSGGSVNIGGFASGGRSPYKYAWSPASGLSRIDIANPAARPSITTKYYVKVTDARSCIVFDSVTVTVPNGAPTKISVNGTLPSAGTATMCAGDSVELDAGAGFSDYLWSTKETTRTIRVKTVDKYWATFESAAGCAGKTDTINVVVSPLPDVRIRGAKVVCINSALSYSVPATVGNTYAWSLTGPTGTITSRADTNYVDLLWGAPGTSTISVRVMNAAGCSDSSTLAVEVGNGLKPVVNASRSPALCAGQSVELDAGSGFATYLWSTGDTTSSIVVSTPGKYAVHVSDGTGCDGVSDTVLVTSKAAPSPSITSSGGTTICANDTTTLAAEPGFAGYAWSSGETTATIDVSSPGTYSVTVIDADSCIGATSITIGTRPVVAPKILPSGNVSVCENDSLTLVATSGFPSYLWSTGEQTSSIVVRTAGTYWVEVLDTNGCKGLSDTAVVTVLPRAPKPTITLSGDTLVASPADTYQWLRNDVEVVGATSQRYVMTSTGRYTVLVSNVGTCFTESDPVTFGVDRVVWIDTVSSRVGERIRMSVRVADALSDADSVNGYDVHMHIEPSALFPHEAMDAACLAAGIPTAQATAMQYTADGKISIVRTVDRPLVVGNDLLFLELEGLVTATPLNMVVIDSVILRTGSQSASTTTLINAGDGLVILSGCEINRTFGVRAQLLSIQPNPANDATVVRYRTPDDSHATLRLVDMQGQVVRSIALSPNTPAIAGVRAADGGPAQDEQSIVFSIDQLATGVYVLQLCDVHEVDALPLIITK